MPSTNISGPCPHCQKMIAQLVWYNIPEEAAGERKDKYYRFIWRGIFIFCLTSLLFLFMLLVVSNEYELKRIAQPDASSTLKAISEANIRLQTELDLAKKWMKKMEEETLREAEKESKPENEKGGK